MSTIRVEGLTKKFADHQALNGVTFEVPENARCVGFLGPNGSGKTTTIRILTGLMKPTSGLAEVAGLNVEEHPGQIRQQIGVVEQHPAFFSWMTGEEFLIFVGKLFGFTAQTCKQRARELLDQVGLTDAGKRRIGRYSGGMKKRLGIAQALMGNPKILFLDEPVAEMDPIGRMEVLELIASLKRDVTVFMSTHILEDVERVSDLVIILHEGAVKSISTIEELRQLHSKRVLKLGVVEGAPELLEQFKNRILWPHCELGWQGGYITLTPSSQGDVDGKLQEYLHQHGYVISHYEWCEPSLEEIFIKVVGE